MIEVYQWANGEYGWRRRSPNGNITAEGESSKRKWNAKRNARKQFPFDTVVDLTRRKNRATT